MYIKYIVVSVFAVCIAVCANDSFAVAQKAIEGTPRALDVVSDELTDNVKLQTIYDQIDEIRRDQINYKIEKDLIREVYSTNYKTVNIVITTILGIFGFFGFFGLRDLHNLHQKYKVDLDSLSSTKKDLEIELKEVQKKQKEAKDSFEEIIQTNEEQNRKIKLLELRDKISSLIDSNIYITALEYCAVALELDPVNTAIRHQKAFSQWRLGRISDSIITYNDILETDKKDQTAIVNLCELYLFNHDIENHERVLKQGLEMIRERNGDTVIAYFEIVKLYLAGNAEKVDNEIQALLSSYSINEKADLYWNFEDFKTFLKGQPDTSIREKLLILMPFLTGSIDKKEVLSRLGQS